MRKPIALLAGGSLVVAGSMGTGAGAQCEPTQGRNMGAFSDVTVAAYSGIFRMPTTAAISEGTMLFGFSAGTWVRQTERIAAQMSAANYCGVVGLLPGVEVGLSALTPSLFNGNISDRAAAAKWAVIPEHRDGFSLAIGSTDLQGTAERKTDYIAAGQSLNCLHFYAGYGRGLMNGPMAGVEYDFAPSAAFCAERVDDSEMAGLKLRLGNRVSASVALDRHGSPFVGVGYAIPLKSPEMAAPAAATTADMQSLANRSALVGRGCASVSVEEGELRLSYEDVEARDPLRSLARVLRLCVDAAPSQTKRLVVTVRRFGFDLVTLSGPLSDFKSFIGDFETAADFLRAVRIGDGAEPGTTQDEVRAGKSPGMLVTLMPGIDYSLGVVDDLPNKEYVGADAIVRLPWSLLGSVSTDANLNNSLDDTSVLQPPTFALYRTDRLAPGLWTMAGIDRDVDAPWSATLQAALLVPNLPLQIEGSASQPLFQAGFPNQQKRFSAEADLEMMSSTLSLFARRERFAAGDVGNTIGFVRRFGQTWVTVENIESSMGELHVRRTGVVFSLPLPEASIKVGPVRFATAATADFSYLATPHASPTYGLGVGRRPLISPPQDLTARGQLSAQFIKSRVGELKS